MQVEKKKTLPKLRQLAYSPEVNPLAEPKKITTKKRYVRSGRGADLIDPATGEVHAVATIHQVEERDDAEEDPQEDIHRGHVLGKRRVHGFLRKWAEG